MTSFNSFELLHANFPSPLTLNIPLSVVILLGIYKIGLSCIGYKIAFRFSSNVYINLVLVLSCDNSVLAPNEVIVTSSLLLFIKLNAFLPPAKKLKTLPELIYVSKISFEILISPLLILPLLICILNLESKFESTIR